MTLVLVVELWLWVHLLVQMRVPLVVLVLDYQLLLVQMVNLVAHLDITLEVEVVV
jgi:hypothetical protein